MASPESDFNELATIISMAIKKTRQLNLHTSAYIPSMIPVEAEATKAAGGGTTGDSPP